MENFTFCAMRDSIVLKNQHFNDRKENISLFARANSFKTYTTKPQLQIYKMIYYIQDSF